MRNYLNVTVKQDRECHSCSKKIKKGTRCLTVNSKATGRLWECNSCEEVRVKEFERKRIAFVVIFVIKVLKTKLEIRNTKEKREIK